MKKPVELMLNTNNLLMMFSSKPNTALNLMSYEQLNNNCIFALKLFIKFHEGTNFRLFKANEGRKD